MTSSLIGRDTTTNKDIEIEQGQRTRGLYIIGATGSGKSVLTEQLAVQDAKDGLGFCVLDPHGDLINNIMVRIPKEREKDVILLDPTDTDWPFGLNLFSCTKTWDPLSVELAVNQITHVFEKIFGMSAETPRLNQYVRNIAHTFVGTAYTMVEIPNLLLDKSFRSKVLGTSMSSSSKLFWSSFDLLRPTEQLDRAESTLDRIDSLVSNSIIRNIVGQSRTTINFRRIMDEGKILLISLYAQLDAMTDLLGSIIIGQILLAALSRSDTTKRRQFNLYVDEFQKFATPDMSTLLVEARKYAIGTTIAHQSRFQSGLTDNIRSTTLQAASLVCFRVTSEDTEFLAPSFDTTPTDAGEREKTIPSDVLMHLSDHPQKFIKDFERQFSRKFLQAKALHTREESYKSHPQGEGMGIYEQTYYDTVYPEFPFDDEPIKFDPNDLLAFLEALETMLFDVMHHQGKTREQFDNVMTKWGICCSGMFIPTKRGLKNNLDKTSNILTHMIEEREKRCQARFVRFRDALLRVMSILKDEPILVYPSTMPDENTSRQTHADRKAEIANELTHLPIGTAKVRVPKWDKDAREVVMVEHTIRTILPYTPKADLARAPQVRQKYLEQTRRPYCRPRAEVEEEIRKRTLPPPSTTRRDSIL